MKKPTREAGKKHGDKLEPLIDEAAGRSPPDEEDVDDDPTLLQDDDDEDVENDDVHDRRDVGERD